MKTMINFIIELGNKPFMQWTYLDYIFAALFNFVVFLIIYLILAFFNKI